MSDTSPGGAPGALALLALQAGPRYGEQMSVLAPVVTIGRAAECDVVVPDDSVSARHARLEFDTGAWRITDLDSVNGTSVEGVRLAPQVPTPIPYGSTVRLGGVVMQFRDVPAADPAAARASFVPPPPPTTLRQERKTRFPVWIVLLLLLALVAAAVWWFLEGGRVVVSSLPDSPREVATGAAHGPLSPPALAA